MQCVGDPPVSAGNFVESPCQQRVAEQIIRRFGAGIGADFARADHLAYGGETGPVLIGLQSGDICRQYGRPDFDASVSDIDGLRTCCRLVCRIVEERADVIMQRP